MEWGVVKGDEPLPGKNHFVPKMISLGQIWCILPQFVTGRKHGQSLEALGHAFYVSIAKRSLQKQCKNYPNIHGQSRGGRSHRRPPPPRIRHCLDIRELASMQHDLTVDALHKTSCSRPTELVNILTSTRPILFHFLSRSIIISTANRVC